MTDFVVKPKAITDPELGRLIFLVSVQAANEERNALETVLLFLRVVVGCSLGDVLVSRPVRWEAWTTVYLCGLPVHRQRWARVGETGLQLVQEWIAGVPSLRGVRVSRYVLDDMEPGRRIVVAKEDDSCW